MFPKSPLPGPPGKDSYMSDNSSHRPINGQMVRHLDTVSSSHVVVVTAILTPSQKPR